MHRRTGTRSTRPCHSQASQQRALPPRRTREKQRSLQRRNLQSGRTWVTLAPQYQTRGGVPTASFSDLSGYHQRICDVIGEGGLDQDATDAEVGFSPC